METAPLDAARELVRADADWELVEGTLAYATPSAPLTRAAYETLRDEILGQIRAALPLDAVALSLHGAMLAEGYPDCEGDLLTGARSVIGPGAALGAELDLHCHISPAMIGAADALVTFKEYPHSDYAARGEELVLLLARCARGEVRPAHRGVRLPPDWALPHPGGAHARIRGPHAGARTRAGGAVDIRRARLSVGRHAPPRDQDAGGDGRSTGTRSGARRLSRGGPVCVAGARHCASSVPR